MNPVKFLFFALIPSRVAQEQSFIMNSSKMEWRSFIKVSAPKGLSFGQIYTDLKKVFGNMLPTYETIRFWYNRFKSGDTDILDKPKAGRPQTGTNNTNLERVSAVIVKERRLRVREVAKKTKLSYGTVYIIITLMMGLVIRCARWIPKFLTAA
jgi:transposase